MGIACISHVCQRLEWVATDWEGIPSWRLTAAGTGESWVLMSSARDPVRVSALEREARRELFSANTEPCTFALEESGCHQ